MSLRHSSRPQNVVEHNTKKRNATIVPIIISSDKTQLTTFRNKTAYPVYLTLGNLPKNIRRKPSRQGLILLGYLPTTKLDHVTNKSSRRRSLANLFHRCMKYMLSPLEHAGREGVILVSGDGAARLCFQFLRVMWAITRSKFSSPSQSLVGVPSVRQRGRPWGTKIVRYLRAKFSPSWMR